LMAAKCPKCRQPHGSGESCQDYQQLKRAENAADDRRVNRRRRAANKTKGKRGGKK